jgi:tetratricopeptide (TPR) repeat protein
VACYSRSTSLWRPGLEARASIGLGDAYRKQGRHEDAGRAYERALDGCSRPEAEQVVQAVSVAIQTEPANARAPYVRALAKAYRQSGMPDKATEIEGQAVQR